MKGFEIMMQGWAILLLFPLIVSAGQGSVVPSNDLATVGRQSYITYCSSCHGQEGRGNGPVASALLTPPADLTQIAKRRGGTFPADEIAAHIDGRVDLRSHGNREMPVWGEHFGEVSGGGGLGDEMVRDSLLVLVHYLESIQQ